MHVMPLHHTESLSKTRHFCPRAGPGHVPPAAGGESGTCGCWRWQQLCAHPWLLGEGQGEWLLLQHAAHGRRAKTRQPPLASPCPSLQETALQPSQALGPPDCTLTMMATHPSSPSTSALRLSCWGQGTPPLSRGRDSLSRLASPGVTHGQCRRGVMDLPTQESQPPLCTIVSGYTGAERCLVSL